MSKNPDGYWAVSSYEDLIKLAQNPDIDFDKMMKDKCENLN